MHAAPDDQALVTRMRTAHQLAREALNVRSDPDQLPQEAWGWHGRTLGRPVTGPNGHHWLRLAGARTGHTAHTFWNGAHDGEAELPTDLPRPRLRRVRDWTDPPWQYRAELYDREQADPISGTMFPEHIPELPNHWWSGLRAALRQVAAVRTTRRTIHPRYLNEALPRILGTRVQTEAITWETAHGDLHWTNLYTPLRIIDWEGWGLAPAGYDPAMLHAHSVLHPSTAARIHREFPILDTPTGRLAQLVTIAELLDTISPDPCIDTALRAHAESVLRHSRRQ